MEQFIFINQQTYNEKTAYDNKSYAVVLKRFFPPNKKLREI